MAKTRLGARYLEHQQPHPAAAHLQKAVQLDPHNQSALYTLQRALRADGQIAQADAVKKRLADLLLQRDRVEQSFLSAIQINNEGAALEKSRNLAAALEKYRAARDLAPSHSGIRVNYAVALIRLSRWKEGLDELSAFVRMEPDNPRWKAALDDALWQAPVSLGGQGRPPKSLAAGTRY